MSLDLVDAGREVPENFNVVIRQLINQRERAKMEAAKTIKELQGRVV